VILVWLINIDSEMPNIALAKLNHWHKEQGHQVELRNRVDRDIWEPMPDIAYASSIFTKSEERRARFRQNFPTGLISGTGVDEVTGGVSVEEIIGLERGSWDYENYDFSIYPDFVDSIGFSQRGCRMKCKFCGVPTKEGKPVSVNAISAIWRGEPYPRHIHLLDNDFFGQPDWREKIAYIRDGEFKVCMSQGINIRLINDEGAKAFSTIKYCNKDFTKRRLYTAWDLIGNEDVFFRGIDILENNGIPPDHVMAYMLIGWAKDETWERIWYRFTKMVERGISPYPMVFAEPGKKPRRDLKAFQRWVLNRGGMYRWISWGDYDRGTKSGDSLEAWKPYADRLKAALPKLQKEIADVPA
jgi:hypothetical protein